MIDYGDFTELEVRTMVADYCKEITLGYTGWGIPFTHWIEHRGLARIDPDGKAFGLIRMCNADSPCDSPMKEDHEETQD